VNNEEYPVPGIQFPDPKKMNERILLVTKILLLCTGCAAVGAAVIYVLKEWLGWL
jgi:hypothetical protein